MTEQVDVGRWIEQHRIFSARLLATNHDGLVLGKHVAVGKLESSLATGFTFADTCFGVDPGGDVALGWDWGGWRGEVTDIRLVPDPATLVADPELPGLASVICDFTDLDGRRLPACYRGLVRALVGRLAERRLAVSIAPELEFMVFAEPIETARAQGYRELTPLGGNTRVTYLISRSHEMTVFMDAVVRRLEALGIGWESWSNETAPGQAEINLAPADPLTTGDAVTRAKLALREVASELGRSVTFMAMGIDEHLGGGMHLNLSVHSDGANAFFDEGAEGHRSELMRRWLAGMLATLPGSMSLLTPNVNSYRRLVELTGPPMTATWGEDNKSAALRTVTRDPATARIEHRVPSADCNIYLALASALAGGLIGIEDELEPPPELEGMAWMLPPGAAPRLPDSLKRAAGALAADRRLAEAIGSDVVDYWLGSRDWEWLAFHTGGGDPDRVGEYELRRYFETA
jgi:glutamine synthetase